MNTFLLKKQLQVSGVGMQYPEFQDVLIALMQLPQSTKLLSNHQISIIFGKDGKQVRKVNKRSNARVTGKFPSRKNYRPITWESKIELNGYQILEASPLVKSYMDQPAELHFTMNGTEQKHVPDTLIELVTGKMAFIEFKDRGYHGDQALIARTQFLAANLPALGYSYVVVTEDQMPETCIKNAAKLNHLANYQMPMGARETIKRVMQGIQMISIKKLLAIVGHKGLGQREVFSLIRHGDIYFNCNEPLNGDTLLTWGESA